MLKSGIYTQIYSLINNPEIRPTANIIISDGLAYEYISNLNSDLDKLSTRYYETFFDTSVFTGFTADLTIGEFYNKLTSSICNSTAILGTLPSNSNGDSIIKETTSKEDNTSSKENANEEENSMNFGIAVFSKDKMIGKLSSKETTSHLLIDNNVYSFIASVEDPNNANSSISLSLSQSKNTKISVDVSNDFPNISIELFITGKILTVNENSNYSSYSSLESLSTATTSYLENLLYPYLYKTSKEFSSDIDGFGKYALKAFLTQDEWENYNWRFKYSNASFNVTINCEIESSLLLTNS